MRYFKDKYFIYEATDDLTNYRWIYDLVTKEHLKDTWCNTRPIVWKNYIELTKNDLFIELL